MPVAGPAASDPGSLDTIGDGEQHVLAENLIVEAVLYQGDTVFKPPDWEFRFTPVFNINHARRERARRAEGAIRTPARRAPRA